MDELERFKRDINLVEYAAAQGYQLDKEKTSRGSIAMRHPDTKDKISIKKAEGGHYVYYSNSDPRDNGSIIDFVQRRKGLTLGAVRQELRRWAGDLRPQVDLPEFVRKLEVVQADRPAVAAEYATFSQPDNSRYLNGRGIRPETLTDPRFRGTWRQDQYGNVLFPHHDAEGLSGFEKKGYLTGFSKGGIKSVWHSKVRATDTRLVFTEGAIDAMSYHQLRPDENTRYMSTGGELSPHQWDLIGRAVARMPPGSTIVSAFDRDAGGEKLDQKLRDIVQAIAPHVTVVRDAPGHEKCKDWNDVLKLEQREYIRSLGRTVGQGRELSR